MHLFDPRVVAVEVPSLMRSSLRVERMPRAHVLGQVEQMISAAEEWGIAPANSSRLYAYRKHLRATKDAPTLTRRELELDLVTRLECELLYAAFVDCGRGGGIPGWREVFEAAIAGGGVYPEDSPKPDAGKERDRLAELTAAAMFRRTGFQVECAEPDLVLTHGGRRYGVPVKRPRSIKTARRLAAAGVNQLERHDLTGFLVLDLTVALDAHRRYFDVPTEAEFHAAAHRVMGRMREATKGMELRRMLTENKHTVAGALLVTHFSSKIRSDGQTMLGHVAWAAIHDGGAIGAHAAFNDFLERSEARRGAYLAEATRI